MTIAEKIVANEAAADKSSTQPGSDKRRALGRGLDSLLPGRPRVVPPAVPAVISGKREADGQAQGPVSGDFDSAHTPTSDEIHQIALDHIDANPYQTRKNFDDEALKELAESIRSNGLLQPIVVRPGANGRFVLVLGERRCRASRMAGKDEVPAIVRRVSDQHAAEMTVVENLMRQDLSCMEQASAFSRLSQEFGLTQEQIGQHVGMSRESVSNYMRLLRLPAAVQSLVSEGKLGFSEARALLQLSDVQQMERLASLAAQQGFSVIMLQRMIDQAAMRQTVQPETVKAKAIDPNVRAAQSELEKLIGLRVKINDRKGRGKIIIEYSNLEDFDRVFEMLRKA